MSDSLRADVLDAAKNAEYKKPPIGIIPRKFHDSERRITILKAIERYSLAELPIPIDWVRELMDLEYTR